MQSIIANHLETIRKMNLQQRTRVRYLNTCISIHTRNEKKSNFWTRQYSMIKNKNEFITRI